jgi:GntR family transcriptional regulator
MLSDSSSPAASASVVQTARPTTSPTFSPLYRQIKELMLSALGAGEWAPGMAIPSESELAVRFGVSQGTVRKAIDEMAAEHLLVRRQGKGTFVESHNDPRSNYRFLRLKPDDRKARQKRSIPLSCKLQPAEREAAAALHLAPGEPVLALERLLSFDDEVVVFDQMYLRADIFGELTLESLQQEERSLYSLFERRFGVRMIRAEERLRAVTAERRVAELLKVEETSPLMLVERITYTYGDQPVEWRRGFYATNRYHYYNELS